jgi:hypothetical protein
MPLLAAAQKKDSVKTDSLGAKKYIPTGVRVGTDAISIYKSHAQNNFSGWEVNGDVDFDRYYLALDYGSWGRKYSGDSVGSYSNRGNYWRVGVDVNFLTKDPEKNMFFLGMRYGRSVFSEDLTVVKYYNSTSNPWGDFTQSYSTNNLHARWFELTTGIKVKMWKIFWMGYTARFKFALNYDQGNHTIPSDVPGYGRADKTSYWGFNYQLFVRIPVRKQPVPVKK